MSSNKKIIDISFITAFAISFCLGIVFAAFLKIPFYILFLIAFLCLLLASISLRKASPSALFILLLAFLLGALYFSNSQTLPKCHIAKITPYRGAEVTLRGVVISEPVIKNKRTSFIFNAKEIIHNQKTNKLCGKVQVIVFGKNKFIYGQELILRATLYQPMDFRFSARLRYRDYLSQQGIYSLLSVKSKDDIQYLKDNQANPIQAFSFWLKHKTQEIIRRNLNDVPLSILEAMLLGERRGIPEYINTAMIHTGTVHILVVSGFNVGIVAFIILLFLKAISVPRKARYAITIISLIIYCLMTGASVPVVRATIMASTILIGYFLKRQANIYNSLSLAALIILLFNPKQLFNIGFQLSFISVLAIVWLYPKIYHLFPLDWRKIKLINWLIQIFSVSLSAWVGTAGLIAYYFQIFSPMGILANMVIAPYASLITACGLSLVLISMILPPLAKFFAQTTQLLVILLIKINLFFEGIPGAYFNIPVIKLVYILLYYSAIFILVFLYERWYNKKQYGFNLK